MPAAMEREILRYSRSHRPAPELKGHFAAVLEGWEDQILRSGAVALAQIGFRSPGDVQVLLAAGLLLLEDEPREIPEPLYLAPGKLLNVALPQSREAGEKECPFQCGIPAVGGDKLLDLLGGKILTLSLRHLESLHRIRGVGEDDPLLVRLVQTSPQLVEVRHLGTLGQPIEPIVAGL